MTTENQAPSCHVCGCEMVRITKPEWKGYECKSCGAVTAPATRETRGTAPANLQDLVKNFVLKYMSFSYNCAADFDLQLAEKLKNVAEFAEVYAAARVSQPVAPDAHRTLQTIFSELNDPESGESERWVKIEEILHQYFRAEPVASGASADSLLLMGEVYRCPACKMPLSGTPEGHLPGCSVRRATVRNLLASGWKSPESSPGTHPPQEGQ